MYYLTDMVAAGFEDFNKDLSYRGLTVLTITAQTLVCRERLQQGVLRLLYERTSIHVVVKQRLECQATGAFLAFDWRHEKMLYCTFHVRMQRCRRTCILLGLLNWSCLQA